MAADTTGGRAPRFDPMLPGSRSVDAIAARLRMAINLGIVGSGQRLPKEAELAAQLQVSMFSLREALGRLREEGLVSTRPGRGGGTVATRPEETDASRAQRQLASLSAVALRDLGDWRSMLVAEEADLGAQRASAGSLRRCAEFLTRMDASVEVDAFTRAEARYFIELSVASQSLRLTSAELDFHQEFGSLYLLANESVEHRERVRALVEELQVALESRDDRAARSVARRYVLQTNGVLVRTRLQLIAETL